MRLKKKPRSCLMLSFELVTSLSCSLLPLWTAGRRLPVQAYANFSLCSRGEMMEPLLTGVVATTTQAIFALDERTQQSAAS
jgi:hypothetical protein